MDIVVFWYWILYLNCFLAREGPVVQRPLDLPWSRCGDVSNGFTPVSSNRHNTDCVIVEWVSYTTVCDWNTEMTNLFGCLVTLCWLNIISTQQCQHFESYLKSFCTNNVETKSLALFFFTCAASFTWHVWFVISADTDDDEVSFRFGTYGEKTVKCVFIAFSQIK